MLQENTASVSEGHCQQQDC